LAMVKQHGGLFLSVDLVPVYTHRVYRKAMSSLPFENITTENFCFVSIRYTISRKTPDSKP